MSSLSFLTFTVFLYQLFTIECHVFMMPDIFYNNTDLGPNEKIVFRVVNGKPAALGQFPYQVAFMRSTSPMGRGRHRGGGRGPRHRGHGRYTTFCGGTIIKPMTIISAAHCFETKMMSNCFKGDIKGKDLKNMFAVAGQLESGGQPNSRGQWRRLRRGRMPKNYKFPKNDIAYIVTMSPFRFNQYVSPMALAKTKMDYTGSCVASGYGRTSRSLPHVSPILLYAHLEIIPIRTCNAIHRRDMSKFVCTSDAISDVFKGDSGGPLVCHNTRDVNDRGKGVLCGITSGKLMTVRSGTFFTRVTSHARFAMGKSCNNFLSLYLLIMSLLFDLLFILVII